MNDFIKEMKDYQKFLETCADRAYDKGENIPVNITVDGKALNFTLNADLFDNLQLLINEEIDYLEQE